MNICDGKVLETRNIFISFTSKSNTAKTNQSKNQMKRTPNKQKLKLKYGIEIPKSCVLLRFHENAYAKSVLTLVYTVCGYLSIMEGIAHFSASKTFKSFTISCKEIVSCAFNVVNY